MAWVIGSGSRMPLAVAQPLPQQPLAQHLPPPPPQQQPSLRQRLQHTVLHEVRSIDGVCLAQAVNRDDLDPDTTVYFVHGVYRAGPQRRELSRWVPEEELHRVLRTQSAEGGVHAAMAALWSGPGGCVVSH